jgi:hypothetical protein
MNKPQGYDNVQAAGGYEKLKVGGHILVIKKVEEGKTYAGKDKITVYFDTDKSDAQPNFFTNAFKNDTRQGKKWPWNGHKDELVYTADGDTSGFFKAFIEAVEKSNSGFKVQWGNDFEKCFVNKLVGATFRNEEYDDNGVNKMAIKFMNWNTVEQVKQGIEPPKDKLLNPSGNSNSNYTEDITPVDDGDMPF